MVSGIAQEWRFSFNDLGFLAGLPRGVCLEAALQLGHVRRTGRFTEDWSGISNDEVLYVASQIEISGAHPHRVFDNRTARRYRAQIADYLGLSRPSPNDLAALEAWLRKEICPRGGSISEMTERSCLWLRDHRILPPPENSLARIVRSVRREFLEEYLTSITNRLPLESVVALEASLADPRGEHGFQRLKDDVGAATLDNVLGVADRLAFIQGLDLPLDLFRDIDPSWIKILTCRVDGETASEMRRHSNDRRLGLFAVYLMSRRAQVIDSLVDLLIEVVHRIGTKSRQKVISRIAADIEKVHGKERLLVDIATAAMLTPNGRVAEVIFPVAGAAKLKAIIGEYPKSWGNHAAIFCSSPDFIPGYHCWNFLRRVPSSVRVRVCNIR